METNKPKLNVGFFFLCLGLLITLITSVVSFLNLVFGTLNKEFPDVLNSNYQYGYSTYDYDNIRMALATLIIFFPIFLAVSYFWRKYSKGEMGTFDQTIKKWVMYIILFLSSVVMVIDLVALVKYFIAGEITNRFIYKVLSVFVIAVLVGFYYILLVKGKEKKSTGIIFGSIGLILVIASVWYSFSIMGSPAKQRLLRLDDRRVNDLQSIQYQVINYWQQKEKLPTKLSDLSNPMTGYSLPVDPEFAKGNTYEYIPKEKLKFELCATFALPMPKGWREYSNGGRIMPMIASDVKETSSISYPYPGGINESWDHQTGRTCYERTIDKDIYRPFPKN
ncbi:MAG: DUF5671 domain-containing protein [Candidatus Nomurabacteria bacterium]|nr:DUF5671 domain-containing protein [Candidatus Nomurabacteria bacterium]